MCEVKGSSWKPHSTGEEGKEVDCNHLFSKCSLCLGMCLLGGLQRKNYKSWRAWVGIWPCVSRKVKKKGCISQSYRWGSGKVFIFRWFEYCVCQCSSLGKRALIHCFCCCFYIGGNGFIVSKRSCVTVNQVSRISLPLSECVEENLCGGRGAREGLKNSHTCSLQWIQINQLRSGQIEHFWCCMGIALCLHTAFMPRPAWKGPHLQTKLLYLY